MKEAGHKKTNLLYALTDKRDQSDSQREGRTGVARGWRETVKKCCLMGNFSLRR